MVSQGSPDQDFSIVPAMRGHGCTRLRLLGTLFVTCLLGLTVRASVQVNYALPGPIMGYDHTLSDGTPIPGGFEFQIGIFQNGFIPSPSNIGEWHEHWRGLIAKGFLLPYGVFGAFTSEEAVANFPVSQRLYVLGYRQISESEAEAYLVTDPDWKVPTNNPFATPLEIDINLASEVIVGSINPIEENIQTAQVSSTTAPPHFYSEWLLNQFDHPEEGDITISGPNADPDEDGIQNSLEYLSGLDPKDADTNPLKITALPGGDLKLSMPLSSSARASWTLRHSLDLNLWGNADPQPSLNETLSALELSFTPGQEREFWRFRLDAVDP